MEVRNRPTHALSTVKIKVVSAKDLKSPEGGVADPFIIVSVGKQPLTDPQAATHRTRTIKKSITPAWNEEFEISVKYPNEEHIWVQVYDSSSGKDEPTGTKSVSISRLMGQAYLDEWFTLENVSSGKVQLQITYRAPPGGTMIVGPGQGGAMLPPGYPTNPMAPRTSPTTGGRRPPGGRGRGQPL